MNQNRIMPWILADMPRRRIRIPKHTLRSLGNPEFVRLLINPETRSLAIEVCDQTEPRKHRVPAHVKNSKICYEIYSASLFDQLREHTGWDGQHAYKLFAKAQAGERLLVFQYDEAYRSVAGMLIINGEAHASKNI